MVDGKSPAEPWLKEAFEDEYPDAELEWELLLDQGVSHYIGDADRDITIEAAGGAGDL
ncbi:hypothetical protein [Natronorubrum bangense]|uniref:ThiB subfamily ABC transporter periplasmic binding protein n=1 Tax=Natronorubrum bangense JCM 10635 TaxID=1227500 RepID=L9WT81_9EURY|nr:hypothetical protein [Natronorubrum bangense]ELY52637.1 ThiB subfamily ABC transporter periplasmic binding protein [Natronorubrum bangense JCM 10635]